MENLEEMQAMQEYAELTRITDEDRETAKELGVSAEVFKSWYLTMHAAKMELGPMGFTQLEGSNDLDLAGQLRFRAEIINKERIEMVIIALDDNNEKELLRMINYSFSVCMPVIEMYVATLLMHWMEANETVGEE